MPYRFVVTVIGLAAGLLGAGSALASDIALTVKGAEGIPGEIACKLYSSAKGFPKDGSAAQLQRVARGKSGAACRFRNVKPGTYALVAALLPAGQADIARDLFGRPRQPWGVSNNVRPSLRAPTFQEAAFQVSATADAQVTIQLAK